MADEGVTVETTVDTSAGETATVDASPVAEPSIDPGYNMDEYSPVVEPDTHVGDEQSTDDQTVADTDTTQDDSVPYGLVEEAVRAGLPLEKAQQLAKSGLLDDVLNFGNAVWQSAQQQVVQPEQETDVKPQEQQKPFSIELDPEVYDENIIGAFNKMKDYYDSKVAGLEQTVKSLSDSVRGRETSDAAAKVERMFSDLAKDSALKGVFGEGDARTLDKSSPEWKNRLRLLNEMDALAAGYHARQRAVPSEEELMRRALRSEFGQELESTATQKVRDQLRSREGQFVARPTQRDNGNISPTQQAVAAVAAKLREFGLPDN